MGTGTSNFGTCTLTDHPGFSVWHRDLPMNGWILQYSQ